MDVTRLLHPGSELKTPYGGVLTNLVVEPARAHELKAASRDFPSLDLTPRQISDVEMLASGAFSPLRGFLGRADYDEVCEHGRLASGRLWPIPIMLDVSLKAADGIAIGRPVALRDDEGTMLAVLRPTEVWERDPVAEAERVYGTTDPAYPGIRELTGTDRRACIGGTLEVIAYPTHQDFAAFRATPTVLRQEFERRGVGRVLGFAVHRLLHRAHVEFGRRAAQLHNAQLLLLGAVGRNGSDDPNHYALVRAWRAVLPRYAPYPVRLALSGLAVRSAGARAELLQAIVSRNFGCSHVVAEHDNEAHGNKEPQYGRFHSLETLERHSAELGLEVIGLRELVYEEDHPEHFLSGRRLVSHVSDAGLAEAHIEGPNNRAIEVARWFSYPEVMREWQRSFRLRSSQGVTIFFTGLSGAGKSTIAQSLHARLMESGQRMATLLDGDIVRKNLSAGLGFSREHRDVNVLRLGFVSSLIVRHGGVAICAPIAPYADTRARVRATVAPYGGFVEVHVATPIEVCESRDRKGLYARARAGLIKEFTGISDPYEAPTHPEIAINTAELTVEEAVEQIVAYLESEGYLSLETGAEAAATDGAGGGAPIDWLALLGDGERIQPPQDVRQV
jgi:sulfate adenylyltransferase